MDEETYGYSPTDLPDDEVDPSGYAPATGGLSPMDAQLLSMLQSNYTTQEAKDLAKNTYQELDQERTQSRDIENQKLKEMGGVAEQAKAELKAAREKLLAKRYNNAEFWFSAAQGFGNPGKTGNFFEGLGNAAGNVVEPLRKKREWEDARDVKALEYALKTGEIDEQQAARELAVIAARQKNDSGLMREAMKIMGKEVRPGQQLGNKGMDAMDRIYAKDYVDFIQNGSATGSRALAELGDALGHLKSGDDWLTGPVVGLIPKVARDIGLPESANVQEMIEYTVQQSLRPILGAQFTEKEGERLISRVYNPRLSEATNARRLSLLVSQLRRAYDNKVHAAKYFEKFGTLRGYKGKTSWSVDDIWSPSGKVGSDEYDNELTPSEDAGKGQTTLKDVIDDDSWLKKRARRWGKRLGFAEGGEVIDMAGDQEAPDSLGDDLSDATIGAILGGLGTKYGVRAGLALSDFPRGTRVQKGERRIIDMMERGHNGGLTPDEWADQLAQRQKLGVPSMALDVASPEIRGLGEAAMADAHKEAPGLLEDLEQRQNSQRERVSDRINNALAPDDFFDQEQKLLTNLYGNAKPMYKAAYEANPSVASKQLMRILDTPSGKKAVKNAITAIQDTPGGTIGKADALGMVAKPSLEFLDQVKRELDDMISKEERKGATGKGKRLRELRNSFRSELDEATKDPKTGKSLYTDARQQYAGDLEVLDALRMGREDFHKMAPREVENLVNGMSFAEKDALRTGAAQKMFELLDAPSSESNAARKIVGSPAMLGRMKPLFNNDKQFEMFKEALQAEMEMYDTSRGVLRRGENVRTGAALESRSFWKKLSEKMPKLAPYSPTAWVLSLIRAKPQIGDKEADAILKLMRTQNPDDIRQLSQKVGRTASRKKIAGRAGTVAALAAAAAPFLTNDSEPLPPKKQDALGPMPKSPVPTDDDPVFNGLTPEQIKWAKEAAE